DVLRPASHSFPTRRSSDLIEGDPEATLDKMQQVIRAALAPAEPSAQDRKVAAAASQAINAARAEVAAMDKAEAKTQVAEQTEARSEEHTSELQSRENLVCR